jgi:hypothetical protein
LGLSEGDGTRSVSQASLGEMNEEDSPPLGFLGEWWKQLFLTYHEGPHGKIFLEIFFLEGSL